MESLFYLAMEDEIRHYLEEDDLGRNHFYLTSLPAQEVRCHLKFKSDMVVAGLNYFLAVFHFLGAKNLDFKAGNLMQLEGKLVSAEDKTELVFTLPFALALMGERLALNLLQKSSAIATHTHRFVDKINSVMSTSKNLFSESEKRIAILDTRKTTPGLRGLEKYAVRVGGGHNHRFGQMDAWMIKDNHKQFFGGIKESLDFFHRMQSYYAPLILEIHSLQELEQAITYKVKHLMLDNFSPEDIRAAIKLKKESMSFELSGGITLENIQNYIIPGIDAISTSSITSNPPAVDISLKYFPNNPH